MPSYIEFEKSQLEKSSDVSRVVFGINENSEPILVDSEGNQTKIGGSGIELPQPIVNFDGDGLVIHFMDTGFDFTTSQNPEIFLFRWKNTKKKTNRKKGSGWVHPSTTNATIKWEGWKFFNGEHKYNIFIDGQLVLDGVINRETEWGIPTNILPYENINITFNRHMFWRLFDNNKFSPNIIFDENFVNESDGYTDITNLPSNIKIASNRPNSKVVKYCVALAVDNPSATKTNGLCPKIFGPFSEPFYSVVNKFNGIYGEIKLIKQNHFRKNKVVSKRNFL